MVCGTPVTSERSKYPGKHCFYKMVLTIVLHALIQNHFEQNVLQSFKFLYFYLQQLNSTSK